MNGALLYIVYVASGENLSMYVLILAGLSVMYRGCKKANKGGLRKFGCNVALYKYVSFYLFLFIINDDVD